MPEFLITMDFAGKLFYGCIILLGIAFGALGHFVFLFGERLYRFSGFSFRRCALIGGLGWCLAAILLWQGLTPFLDP